MSAWSARRFWTSASAVPAEGGYTEIRSGLNAEELVVSAGSHVLKAQLLMIASQ